ncbi:MAG TPA: alanine--tRNA ligase [Solirubrobacterales bacterium]|nr:alanine--tRNA ligase [Solirubrobacterales bacterium]
MKSAEIRETYLSFFEERAHRRMPSASLVPPPDDTSTLLTVAGMQPFKPYFLGREQPPATRLTSSQTCFRTPDIEEVGKTLRHLTFFEMLGNFSFGDYFKEEAIPFGWQLSTEGFGFDPELIWITVFGGDEELGLGPDEEAIEIWKGLGVPDERIVKLPRSENFWQGGPTGPCGPCSEMYLDRGLDFGSEDDRPGDDSDRFLEYWNHVFMSYDQAEDGTLSPLPSRNIDTGMGLERMAAIIQDADSVYDTDLFSPLIELAEEKSGLGYGDDESVTRAMRVISDHSRGMTFLLAAGVVPSNEDRGYVLRRVMRRAIQQGRSLGLEGSWLSEFTDRTIEMMGEAHPQVVSEKERIDRWVKAEEESFGRTLDRGTALLEEIVDQALAGKNSWISAEDAFRLHDTFGFPYDLTREMVGERGLSVDDQGFEELMEQQRNRARSDAAGGNEGAGRHERILAFAGEGPESGFVGYEFLRSETGIGAIEQAGASALAKLEQSPFYAEGGGQVADSGRLLWEGGEAEVTDVIRIGDDQVLELKATTEGEGAWPPDGATVEALVDRDARFRTMRNHTATHLLHAALRERLGTHVHQAGSSVRPEKLRFDFSHGESLSPEDVGWIEERVNGWIKDGEPVRWIVMEKPEAEKLGAMALFGEKYGDLVRVVEVENVSRELCGGTHVANTAEIGIFKIVTESSSAANVRRIEAITGPDAIDWFRDRAGELDEVGHLLGDARDPVRAARDAATQLAEASEGAKKAARKEQGRLATDLAAAVGQIGSFNLVLAEVPIGNPKEILTVAKQVQATSGTSAVLVGADRESGKVGMVALLTPDDAGKASARDIVAEAAPKIGGGGGGSDEMAQAGGKNPDGITEALAAARQFLESV